MKTSIYGEHVQNNWKERNIGLVTDEKTRNKQAP